MSDLNQRLQFGLFGGWTLLLVSISSFSVFFPTLSSETQPIVMEAHFVSIEQGNVVSQLGASSARLVVLQDHGTDLKEMGGGESTSSGGFGQLDRDLEGVQITQFEPCCSGNHVVSR